MPTHRKINLALDNNSCLVIDYIRGWKIATHQHK